MCETIMTNMGNHLMSLVSEKLSRKSRPVVIRVENRICGRKIKSYEDKNDNNGKNYYSDVKV